jgi:5-methylcytosine-specific restriction protein B
LKRNYSIEIYEAVRTWKDKIVNLNGSLLGANDCWTIDSIRSLRNKFVNNLLDDPGRTFLEKLEEQLDSASRETKQLAAEIMWLLYLFPSSITRNKKVLNIAQVWTWSGDVLDLNCELLSESVMHGIGSGGPAFNNHFWREFLCAIVLSDELSKLDKDKRLALLESPDELSTWITTIPEMDRRQFRHMLLHLLFPNEFERMSSQLEKRKVLSGFHCEYDRDQSDTRLAIDKALKKLRKKIAEELNNPDFSFYDPDVVSRWREEKGTSTTTPLLKASTQVLEDSAGGVSFYVVGATWDTGDKVDEFVEAGIWQNGYTDKYLDVVRSVSVGDKIAIKSAFRQKNDLPFDTRGQNIGVMRIKARGIVTQNPGDGRRLIVDWEDDFEMFDIYGYAYQPTITRINTEKYPYVIDWIFNGIKQPIEQLAETWYGETHDTSTTATPDTDSGLGIEHRPINRIFYGPPGTGKTYKLMEKDGIERMPRYLQHDRVDDKPCLEVVTFHQSYAYEDFIEGLRPVVVNNTVKYEVRNGVFKNLCLRAQENPEMLFALFIDEINRGNVSSIFGEVITLIEPDKRIQFTEDGSINTSIPGTMVRLPVSGEEFGIPCNVDIYATMNTADRSLVRLDTALRRRFEFHECMPEPEKLNGVLIAGVNLERMLLAMNKRIESLLGRDYTIGHAYFMNRENDSIETLANIFRYSILPLLEEYFFDDWSKIEIVLADTKKEKDDRFIIRIDEEKENAYQATKYTKNYYAFSRASAYTGIYDN